MPRRPNPATIVEMQKIAPAKDSETLQVADDLAKWAKKAPKKSKATVSDGRVEKAMREVEEMIATQDWTAAKPIHFVALYEHLHTQVYGIKPGDLDSRARMGALSAAKRILEKEFEAHPDEMADFMRSCWKRERATEKKRRDGSRPDDTFRITWRYQFSGKPVTDYRLSLARRG